MSDIERRKVGFKSLIGNIDSTSAGGKLNFYIFGALLELERNLIADKAKVGLAAARARGRKGEE